MIVLDISLQLMAPGASAYLSRIDIRETLAYLATNSLRRDARSMAPELPDTAARVHRWIVLFIVSIMLVDSLILLGTEQWLSGFLALTIGTVITLATIVGGRLWVRIPSELQIFALVFVFAALFLGEARSFYERFWWWDIVLHASSGLLLGIFGFLLVYVLNESERIDLAMRPRFVALFAFTFAFGVGALWEIFEFAMDQVFGTTMQKPMFGDPSGLTDTMWDLIVDATSAAAISAFGWAYMHRRERSFIDVWIRKFIDHNPQLFTRKRWARRRGEREHPE